MKRYLIFRIFLIHILLSTLVFSQSDSTVIQPDTARANLYFVRGKALSVKADYDSSIYYLEKAKDIYKKAGLKSEDSKIWERYLETFNILVSNLRQKGRLAEAMERLQEALSLVLKRIGDNFLPVAKSYDQLGLIQGQKGKIDDALTYFERSLAIKQQVLGENNKEFANTSSYIGVVFEIKGDFDKAFEYFNKTLKIKQEVIGEKNIDGSTIYSQLGRLHRLTGNYEKALLHLNKYLKMMIRFYGDSHPKVAGGLISLGIVYRIKGNYERALDIYNRALVIEIKYSGEDHYYVAKLYNNIGVVYDRKGDYDEAIQYYKKALTILQKYFVENHEYVAGAYLNIGRIYSFKGEYDKALDYYKKSLNIWMKLYSESHFLIADSYEGIGEVYRKKSNYDKAIEFQNKALVSRIKVLGKDHLKVSHSYQLLGQNFSEKNNFKKAFEFYNKSLAIRLQSLGEKKPEVSIVYRNIGNLFYKQNEIEKALSYAQKSIISLTPEFADTNIYSNPLLDNILSETELLQALELKAQALEKLYSIHSHDLKDMQMSFNTYQLASELIDQVRIGYRAEGSKLFLGENASKIYEKAINNSLKLYHITQNNEYKEKAFLFAEKSKSSVLLSVLQDSRAKQFAGIPDSLLQEESDLRVDLAFYDTQIQRELPKKNNRDSLKIKKYEDRSFALKIQYEQLMEKLETKYPDYYDLKYQIRTASISKLQDILDEKSILLEYFVGDSSIFFFTVSNNDFDFLSVKIDSSFQQMAESLNLSIKNIDSKNFINLCYELYNYLIKPVEEKLTAKDRLIIIPHGILYKTPFETFITQQPEKKDGLDLNHLDYLIRGFDVSYHYSATLYVNSKNEQGKRFARTRKTEQTFVGYAPVFSNETKNGYILMSNLPTVNLAYADVGLRAVTLDGKWFNELEYSEQEVQDIVKILEKEKKKAIGFFHTDASEENFKSHAGNYKYVHVASHGMINEINPKLSGIIFSQPMDSNYAEDGILYSGETYNLNLNADLVVLSSCESGIGKLQRGEGLMALTRGFFYSGVPSLLVSLWSVSDISTAQLMTDFYRNLQKGLSKTEALRKAKLDLIKRSTIINDVEVSFAHPFFWAPFVLIGESETPLTVESRYSYYVFILIVFLGIVLAGILWAWKRRQGNPK
ncbi:CHAT domain-containing protein [candidate division KSB1 bacterium]|nr:CHAT domain-containing protein [candidate division KSB1 bacterium]MBL7094800.1 CHAT domain-containing protein [candidate division KSB1 bacterium]